MFDVGPMSLPQVAFKTASMSEWFFTALALSTMFLSGCFKTPPPEPSAPVRYFLEAPPAPSKVRPVPRGPVIQSVVQPRDRLDQNKPVKLLLKRHSSFVYPVMGPRKSSDFGVRNHPIHRVIRHHHGIDLAAPEGAPIRVIASGEVMYADPYAGYGNLIVVRHADGVTSHYGHCKSISVSPGKRVRAGEVIGSVGSTGISTGPHLHFEVRVSGQPQDPEQLLPGLAAQSEG